MVSNNFIKIFDRSIAEKLKADGFFYAIEKINKKDVFVFPKSDKLLKQLESNYSKHNFLAEDTLRF